MDDVMKCVSCGVEMVFDHFTDSYVCTLCGRSEMRKSEKTSEEPSISMNKEESCRTVLPAEVQKKIDEYRTALSQALTQITSGNKPFIHRNNEDGAFQYSHDSRDLDFRVRKEDDRFSVFYRSYRYDV